MTVRIKTVQEEQASQTYRSFQYYLEPLEWKERTRMGQDRRRNSG